ncbi:hypothetical protein PRIPAC_83983, partial [Pristionchus pacificus]
ENITAMLTSPALILFLNKTDLFRLKIKTKPISLLFHDYRGGNTYDDSKRYIEGRFLELSPNKTPYVHFTCATDTNQVQLVIESVIDAV